MKIRILVISSLVFSFLLFSGCGSDAPADHMADLEGATKNIRNLADDSEDVSSAEEAFTLLRNLNQEIKGVRDAVLSIDTEYANLSKAEFEARQNTPEFRERMARFENAMDDMDQSLQTIKSNVDPYKSDEQVSQMYDKLETILISR
jgi:chromosome segregation ATPase